MKVQVVVLSLALLAVGGGAGYGLMKLHQENGVLVQAKADLEKQVAELKAQQAQEKAQFEKQVAELKEKCEKQVAAVKSELTAREDDEDRVRLQPLMQSVALGEQVVAGVQAKHAEGTELQKKEREDACRQLLKNNQGRRVVFVGQVLDIGTRKLNWKELYVSVGIGEDVKVKFVVDEAAKAALADWKVGRQVVLEGALDDSIDLKHDVTVKGMAEVSAADYKRVKALGAKR